MRPYLRTFYNIVSVMLVVLIILNSTVIAQEEITQRKSGTMQQGINTIEKTTKMISDAQIDLIGDMAIVLGEIAFDKYGGKAMGFVLKDGKEYAELLKIT